MDDRNLSNAPLSTRPKFLPPKSEKEEQIHQKMYLNLLQQYEKNESEKKKKRNEKQIKKEKQILENQRLWKSKIIPKWESMKNSSKAYDLVYKGIPPNLRRTVWSLLIGNDLNITKEQYLNYYKQREDYHKIEAINSTSDSKEKSNPVNLITLDLPRTFPMLAFFQPGGPYHHSLKSILECYVFYNPDIGYVQGMSYLAAILLLYMDEYEAFTAIANLLNRKCHNAFYKLDDGFQVYCRAFNLLLKDYLPNLYHYFLDIGLSEEMYLLDWILTIYGKSLPLDTSTRIWDIYLLEGDILLFKSAIGILKTLEKNILEFAPNLESCKKLLSRIPEEDINEESLIENIRSIDLNTVKFRAILKAAS